MECNIKFINISAVGLERAINAVPGQQAQLGNYLRSKHRKLMSDLKAEVANVKEHCTQMALDRLAGGETDKSKPIDQEVSEKLSNLMEKIDNVCCRQPHSHSRSYPVSVL